MDTTVALIMVYSHEPVYLGLPTASEAARVITVKLISRERSLAWVLAFSK